MVLTHSLVVAVWNYAVMSSANVGSLECRKDDTTERNDRINYAVQGIDTLTILCGLYNNLLAC